MSYEKFSAWMIWSKGLIDNPSFSKSFISPNIFFPFHLILHIILGLNDKCGIQFYPPTSSDDLCLPFCLILILCLNTNNWWIFLQQLRWHQKYPPKYADRWREGESFQCWLLWLMIREHLLWGDISSKGLHRLIKYSPPLLGCIKYKIIYVYSPRLLGCIKYKIIYIFALSSYQF